MSEHEKVYGFGKALVLKRGIEETQLSYPGIWKQVRSALCSGLAE